MRVTVTGATGFLGRHVVAELERRGVPANLVSRSGGVITTTTGIHAVTAFDIHDRSEDAFDAIGRPDGLIHLAWGGLPHYRSLHHFEDELPAQYRFLKAAVQGGVTNLLVSGTCFEYGMVSGSVHEDVEPRPSNPYGFAKNALRIELEYLRDSEPFNLTWARLFYLYGPDQTETSLYSQLASAVRRGEPQFDMSGGDQLRDYLPVAEAAQYLVTLALNGRSNGIVNVCSGVPVSVRALVERWTEENGWSIELNRGHFPYLDHEPMAFWGDRRKLDSCLTASAI